jgi:peptidoglycan/LPS O-acetylase OafA/YrhL
MNSPDPRAGRIDSLESVRGLAALAVVLHHLCLLFWPAGSDGHPLRVLWNGRFAVAVFFVLSGVVLSLSHLRRPDPGGLARSAAGRYFRLMPPVLLSCLLAYGLLVAGLMRDDAFSNAAGRPQETWSRFYPFEPSAGLAFREGVFGAFFEYGRFPSYNASLWTMSVELFGSLLVFAFLALSGSGRARLIAYIVVGFLLWRYHRIYFDFLAGIALCELWVRTGDRVRLPVPIGALILLAGLACGTPGPEYGAAHHVPHLAKWHTAGAILVLGAVLFTPALRRPLDHSLPAWLGRVSFGLYLVHLPIIASVGCGAWLALTERGWSYDRAAAGASIAVVASTLLGAWVMTRLADRPAIVLARRVGRFFVPPTVTPPARSA